jgi:predicted Zn-dependent protease
LSISELKIRFVQFIDCVRRPSNRRNCGLHATRFILKLNPKTNRFLTRTTTAQAAIWLAASFLSTGGLSVAQTSPGSAQDTKSRSSTSQLPNLGDGSDMTSGDERRLGDRIIRELYRDPDYIDDPVLLEYVNDIWQPLLAAARLRGDLSAELDERFAWQILMGRDRSVNAFALPGGYFGLHLGLVAVVGSRDELASVLGHELSHVTQRHISRLMSKQSQQSPWLLGAMILGVLAASKSPDAANALITGGQAVAAQNQLNFSRDMEREADRVGFGVMTQAGFDAQGAVAMFDKLQQASRLNDRGSFPYLRSHPLTTERIADMESRAEQSRAEQSRAGNQPSRAGAPRKADDAMAHALISARARVLSFSAMDDLRGWGPRAEGADFAAQAPAMQAASLYGAAFAALKLRDAATAQKSLARLVDVTRDNAAAARLTRLLGSEMALAFNDARQALKLTEGSAPAPAAPRRPETLLAAQALSGTSQPALAAAQLQTWVTAHPRDAMAWQLLSSAYAAQGQTIRAVRAEAESRVAVLDYAPAVDRFKAAQTLAKNMPNKNSADNIEASIIDTRMRQVALLLKEQAVER